MNRRTNTGTNTPVRTSSGFEAREWLNGATKHLRALSSVGLERLPYKQEVAGSNPAAPIEVTEFTIRHSARTVHKKR